MKGHLFGSICYFVKDMFVICLESAMDSADASSARKMSENVRK